MCVFYTVEWESKLKANRAHYESKVYWKFFVINVAKPRQLPEIGEAEPMLSLYRGSAAGEFRVGKVYFDEAGTIFPSPPVDPDIMFTQLKCYEKGFHAVRTVSLNGRPTRESVQHPVMLADITAIDGGEVAGKVMLIMTREDYAHYRQDCQTPPIKIHKDSYELEPEVI